MEDPSRYGHMKKKGVNAGFFSQINMQLVEYTGRVYSNTTPSQTSQRPAFIGITRNFLNLGSSSTMSDFKGHQK
jgi:hypothetical protein